MWQDIRNHPSALGIAVVLHLLAAIALLVTFDFELPEVGSTQPPQPAIVEAVAVSGAEYDAARQRLEDQKRREQEARVAAERERRAAEERRRREEQQRQQRAAEEKARQEAARREAEAQRQREAAEQARREQAEREAAAQRAAELKRQQEREAEERRLAEQREAERKAEQERLAAQMAAEEAAIREAERRQAEAEAQARLNAQLASLRDEYMAAIVARIQGNWERPLGAPNNQRARIYVRQARGGFITEVKMLRCEGTDAFCTSVLDAVWRSDPLPAPPRDEVFDEELEIEFDPDRS